MLQPSETNIIQKGILKNISDEYDKTVGYLTYDLTRAFALEEKTLIERINDIYSSIDVNNLSGTALETFISQRKGIERRRATYATGVITAKGNGIIPKGALFETKSGIQFEATKEANVIGTAEVPIQAVVSGVSGNVPKNSITFLPVTITGIESVVNEDVTLGGYDAEIDDSLKERYYLALRVPATSGNRYHYLNWALEVPGVGDAKIFPLDKGANTVTVVIIDQDKRPSDDTLVGKVQSYIDPDKKGIGEGQAPIGAHCHVESAKALNINVNFNLDVISGYVKEDVNSSIEDAINQYFKEIAFKQTFVSYAKIGATIIEVEGVKDYSDLTINSGVVNIDVPEKSVAVLGGVTID